MKRKQKPVHGHETMHAVYRSVSPELELCYYIQATRVLTPREHTMMMWAIKESYDGEGVVTLTPNVNHGNFVEIGPRLSIETPGSSNGVSIYQSMMGAKVINRVEVARRYKITPENSAEQILLTHLDRMTEQHYPNGIVTFQSGVTPEPVRIIRLIEDGIGALKEANRILGLGMDNADILYYYNLFVNILKRNPTDVELFQLGNANSEHSRHWFFKGQIVIDGVPMEKTLMQLVQEPLKRLAGRKDVSLIAFRDNAGALRGHKTVVLVPCTPGQPSRTRWKDQIVHITGTAETHNHPTFVSPFPGAQTGAGGRIRDTSAVGRGGITGVGIAGYVVGNLFIPGYQIPGEVVGQDKPSKYASPLQILVSASNGVSSYGNQIGEPLTNGFTRTFGQIVDGEWREGRKPTLYSGGIGHLWDGHVQKEDPKIKMLIVRIGGPGYPIGVGGGSASSMMQGQNTDDLDFASVQRGNAEMENKANRVIRTCIEMGSENPISSIHDQGAGGPSNVLTELMEPHGGKINIRKINLGDPTMSVLKIWSAEFQEGYGFLIRPERIAEFMEICVRERVNCEILGEIDGSGNVVVEDPQEGQTPVNLNLEQILTKMPQKTFRSEKKLKVLKPLDLPALEIGEALKAVFQLPHVGSKGFLVRKVDRSVTGLVVQQQCCGIAQIPIANASINASSFVSPTGSVAANGEQPIIMLINAEAGARMSTAETLANMACTAAINIAEIRCRANWMWPAKLPHEGALLYDAMVSMSEFMIQMGIAVDGGKDSLSMAANIQGETVKSPGSLVVLGYAPMEDTGKHVTPDIKMPGTSLLYGLLDLGQKKNRLGASALAQTQNQIGNECPDVDDPMKFKRCLQALGELIEAEVVLSAHDRSGGGLITTVAEMCMASRCGFTLDLSRSNDTPIVQLFNEELGFVLEVDPDEERSFLEICNKYGLSAEKIGRTNHGERCEITLNDDVIWSSKVTLLRSWWEETSSRIEELQMNPVCAKAEHAEHKKSYPSIIVAPNYKLSFTPRLTPNSVLARDDKPLVAIIREEGTNGEREMHAACLLAGLAPVDVAMSDLLAGNISLDQFQGIIFAGGFSYMDTFGSAKGWAGAIEFNENLKEMFDRFYLREDTFSLGICNGCQLMALLGWIPMKGMPAEHQPRFIHNVSGRFESRWVEVEILPSQSIMLKGMEGSKLGIWVAHGEGQLYFPNGKAKDAVIAQNLAPIALLDPYGLQTEKYPYNPNGSPNGFTALCSVGGQHLAMMPHPERAVLLKQWPWMPSSWSTLEASPWLRMFQNAREWCDKVRR